MPVILLKQTHLKTFKSLFLLCSNTTNYYFLNLLSLKQPSESHEVAQLLLDAVRIHASTKGIRAHLRGTDFNIRKTEELNCLAILNTLQSAMMLNNVVLTAVVRKHQLVTNSLQVKSC